MISSSWTICARVIPNQQERIWTHRGSNIYICCKCRSLVTHCTAKLYYLAANSVPPCRWLYQPAVKVLPIMIVAHLMCDYYHKTGYKHSRLSRNSEASQSRVFTAGEHIICSMLPGYTHNIINLSDTEELVTVMWANEQFDPERPDTFGEEV